MLILTFNAFNCWFSCKHLHDKMDGPAFMMPIVGYLEYSTALALRVVVPKPSDNFENLHPNFWMKGS